MPEHEARQRAFYDHESEEPGTVSRRRHVADWGVSEDVFDRLPSRLVRSERRRGGGGTDTYEHRRVEAVYALVHDESAREHPHDEHAHDEPAFSPSRTIVISGPMEDFPAAPPAPAPAPEPRLAANGRRTVVIGGHPDRLPVERRRPPRTAGERVGASPDRIVAYAVALGFLLILIAYLTANA